MDLPNIDAFIQYGGQINIGSHPPVGCIAVANIEGDTLAMLKCGPDENVIEILKRLDFAIAEADETGGRVDEVNNPSDHYRASTKNTSR